MSKIWVVIGSWPWEAQDPIAAFGTEQDAKAFCIELEERHANYEKDIARFYTKLNKLNQRMSTDAAYAKAGESPKIPDFNYPEYYIQEIDFYADATDLPATR
jgi:hypothetical protein